MKKFNILISAYACNPYKGSEPSVGWGFVTRISKRHDVTALVASTNKKDIQSFYKKHKKNKKLKFIYIEHKRFTFIEKIWAPSYYWGYKKWQKDAFILSKKLTREKKFDMCHQLNMIGFREPGYLWKLNIPFFWGPIGGLTFYSSKFLFNLGIYNFFYSLGYNFLNYLDIKFLKRPKLAFQKANKFIFAANTETQLQIKKYFNHRSILLLPVATENQKKHIIVKKKENVFNIFWGGLHIPRKALNIAIDALSLLPKEIKWKLHITGSGKLTNVWKKYANQKAIGDNCVFYGYVKRENIYKIMIKCDVHLFTSIKEDSPAIIMETTSFGVPTICFDLYGAKDLVNKKTGIKISPSSDHNINALNFKNAVLRLIKSNRERRTLSKNCLKFTKKNIWDERFIKLDKYYQKINAKY